MEALLNLIGDIVGFVIAGFFWFFIMAFLVEFVFNPLYMDKKNRERSKRY